MIITLLLNIVWNFLHGLTLLLPTGHLPVAITTSFNYLWSLVNAFSFVIPVDTLLQAIAVVLAFDGAMMIWRFINWIIRKIPGMQ